MENFKNWLKEQEDIKENKALLAGLMLGASAIPSLAAPPAKVAFQNRLMDSRSPNEQALGKYLKSKGIDAQIFGKKMVFIHPRKTVEINMGNNQISDIIAAIKEALPKLGIDGEFNINDVKGFRGSTETTPPHKFDPTSTHDSGLRPYTPRGDDRQRAAHYQREIGDYRR